MTHSPGTTAICTPCKGQLCGLSNRDIAERLNDLASYIQKAFCSGILLPELPIYPIMKHLTKRLNEYACGFAIDSTPVHVIVPSQHTSLKVHGAKKTMGQLARYFEREAEQLEQSGLGGEAEVAIARDLRFAAKVVSTLLELKQERFDAPDEEGLDTTEPDPIIASVNEQEVLLDHNRRVRYAADSTQSAATLQDVSAVIPEVIVATEATIPASVEGLKELPSVHADQAAGMLELPLEGKGHIHSGLSSASSSGFTTPIGATTPHDLRPTPFAHEHAPHPLQGLRLYSRCGVPDSGQFEELCSQPGKILSSTPDIHTTVQVGHHAPDLNQPHQYVDASILGFPGVNALKIVHPLCARETRMLDFDVLRYIEIVLKECSSEGADQRSSSSERKRDRAARSAEKQSRHIVARELSCRVWELGRQEGHHDAARYQLPVSTPSSKQSVAETDTEEATEESEMSMPSTPDGAQTPSSCYRSDRQPVHPLQGLVGQRELVNSASIQAEVGSAVSHFGDEGEKISDTELLRNSGGPRSNPRKVPSNENTIPYDSSPSPSLRSSRGRSRLEKNPAGYEPGCSARDRLNLEMEGSSGVGMIYPPDLDED